MKKILNKIVCLTLAITCCFSISSFNANASLQSVKNPNMSESAFKGGVHNYEITQTDGYIANNGLTDYSIVIKNDATTLETFAAEELQMLLKEATGAVLPILVDQGIQFTAQSNYISLGNNLIASQAGVEAKEQLVKKQGFIIKTVGKSIFISGAYAEGTLFGVYGWLEKELNFDCFANKYYTIDKVDSLTFKNYEAIDVPDMAVRNAENDFITNDAPTMYRMRYTNRSAKNLFIGIQGVHTIFHFLPKENYPEKLSKWYSSDGTQLCYTARGDKSEYNALKNEFFSVMKEEFKKNTQGYIFNIGQEDKFTWCGCQGCLDVINQYGAESATEIIFCNELAQMMRDWMETDEGKPYARDFKIMFLAYQRSLEAPKKGNLKCDPNVMVCFAADNMDYFNDIYSESNKAFYEAFKGWVGISDVMNVYTYQCNYEYFLVPFDSFNGLQKFYQFSASLNTHWFLDHGQGNQRAGATGWAVLKNYLCSKLSWDVNADVDQLTKKFFHGFYGEVSEDMYSVYSSFRGFSKYLIEEGNIARLGSIFSMIEKAEFWPKTLLLSWYETIQEALEKIKYLRFTDINKYNELYSHIVMERVSVQYLLVQLYQEELSPDFVKQLKYDCKADCQLVGIDKTAENSAKTVMALWQNWGIA